MQGSTYRTRHSTYISSAQGSTSPEARVVLSGAVPKRAPECLCRIALRTGPYQVVGMTYAPKKSGIMIPCFTRMVNLS
jgi:hypothetical protein